jgi:hypothetical protein
MAAMWLRAELEVSARRGLKRLRSIPDLHQVSADLLNHLVRAQK